MLPATQQVANRGLEFDRYKLMLSRALEAMGYIIVGAESEDADLAIMFEYTSGKPEKETRLASEPVYGITGGTSQVLVKSGGYSQLYTLWTPWRLQYLGHRYWTETDVTFSHFGSCVAVDLRHLDPDKKIPILWQVEGAYAGSKSDFYDIAGFLVTALVRAAGTESLRITLVPVRSDDECYQKAMGTHVDYPNRNPAALGVFRHHTAFSLEGEDYEDLRRGLVSVVEQLGLAQVASGDLVLRYAINREDDTLSLAAIDARTGKEVRSVNVRDVGEDWNEVARYAVRKLAIFTEP